MLLPTLSPALQALRATAAQLQLRHPNLQTVMGTSIDPVTRDLLVVLAYLERGTLYDLLHNEVGLPAQRQQRGPTSQAGLGHDLLLLCLRISCSSLLGSVPHKGRTGHSSARRGGAAPCEGLCARHAAAWELLDVTHGFSKMLSRLHNAEPVQVAALTGCNAKGLACLRPGTLHSLLHLSKLDCEPQRG